MIPSRRVVGMTVRLREMWSRGGISMAKFTTPQGREIYLGELSVKYTYEGVLEGSAETASKYMLEDIKGAFKNPNWLPVFVIIPDAFPLPSRTWLAIFRSNRGVKKDDPDFSSRLAVRWFTDSTAYDQSINDLIRSILPLFDWDQHAEDWDIMDF